MNKAMACEYVSFDRWITLKTPSSTRDAFGAEVLSWSTEDIPAGIEYVTSPKEQIGTSQKPYAVTTIVFTIRYRSGLTEKQQITFETNEYDIINIAEVGRRKYSRITAELKR